MNKLAREFVSKEDRKFSMRLGSHLASPLSGFLAGAVVATIVWFAGWVIVRLFFPQMFGM